jgi:Family of unknown function (DUF5906)
MTTDTKNQAVAANDETVLEINQRYALLILGNKVVIYRAPEEDEYDDRLINYLSVDACRTLMANQHVWVSDGRKIVAKPAFDFWVAHPLRRSYDRILFKPGVVVPPSQLNIWQGFACAPDPKGDCCLFYELLLSGFCAGNKEYFAWLMSWLAQIFQQPMNKAGSSVIIRGEEGCGKSLLGRIMKALLGKHYLSVTQQRHLTGNFNSHMQGKLFIHADEAFWAGDKQARGALLDLVTGDTINIEFKGAELYPIGSYIRLLVTGNPDWQVPAGWNARRWFVLTDSGKFVGKLPFFEQLVQQMENGGYGRLLHDLLHWDHKQVNLRDVPKTEGLMAQKIHSASAEEAWLMDFLNEGVLPGGCTRENACAKRLLLDRFIEHVGRQQGRSSETRLALFLKKRLPRVETARVVCKSKTSGNGYYRAEYETQRARVWVFPSLGECREHFAKGARQAIEWDEQADWKHELEVDANEVDLALKQEEHARSEQDFQDRVDGWMP